MSMFRTSRSAAVSVPDARLEQFLRSAMLVAVALVVLLPAARGYSPWLGWTPLWLLGLPAVAWWSLHRFRLPRVRREQAMPRVAPRSRRVAAQARSRRVPSAPRLKRAA